MRERGLKYKKEKVEEVKPKRRSREGAWIEILFQGTINVLCERRSREGAWIEISKISPPHIAYTVAPVRERGLKLKHYIYISDSLAVAPVRERGLKCGQYRK